MRIVLQRVRKAAVLVAGRPVAAIGPGLVALVGFAAQEAPEAADRLAKRLPGLRLFDDAEGRLNKSLQDIGGELLLVPQVTLTASLDGGMRPSFHTAAAPDTARGLFEAFASVVKAGYPRTAIGVFQAHMVIQLENDGPVTVVLDA